MSIGCKSSREKLLRVFGIPSYRSAGRSRDRVLKISDLRNLARICAGHDDVGNSVFACYGSLHGRGNGDTLRS
jgi:hypothetical protein